MVYLKNTTEAQVLFIPKNGEGVSGEMVLVVKNTTNQDEITLPVSDINTSGLYFNLAVVLPDGISEGEYEYTLLKEEIRVSCGLLFIGDLSNADQYENQIKYKQYE